jgi:hypothetical protein
MGIHHTYKSNRGERSLAKQQKQEELRRRAQQRRQQKHKIKEEEEDVYVVPANEMVTLDILTNPNKNR